MRKGKNPAKLKGNNEVKSKAFHQVIVPVYLPLLEGYYKEGLDILKLCVESVYLTVHDKTLITVVNNGSCKKVRHYLNYCLEEEIIHEVIHTSAIGKINAIAKGLSGHNFELVTITDADVLFTNGWQKAVYEIYENFPKAGMVCTTPLFYRIRNGTEMIFWDNLFNKELKFREVKSPEDQEYFMKSIEGLQRLNKFNKTNFLCLKNKYEVVLGAGHFCSTYRPEVLKKKSSNHENVKMSPKSMRDFLDDPVIKHGLWKLSTSENFTYHMGNTLEQWMKEKFNSIKRQDKIHVLKLSKPKTSVFFNRFKIKIIRLLIFNNYIWVKYLNFLGLNKQEAKEYLKKNSN